MSLFFHWRTPYERWNRFLPQEAAAPSALLGLSHPSLIFWLSLYRLVLLWWFFSKILIGRWRKCHVCWCGFVSGVVTVGFFALSSFARVRACAPSACHLRSRDAAATGSTWVNRNHRYVMDKWMKHSGDKRILEAYYSVRIIYRARWVQQMPNLKTKKMCFRLYLKKKKKINSVKNVFDILYTKKADFNNFSNTILS